MNEEILLNELKDSKLYYIKLKDISYYISIPNNKEYPISLTININNDINKENINNIYDHEVKNLVLITPIIKEEELKLLKENNLEIYEKINMYISFLINRIHKQLLEKGYTINNKIKLVNIDSNKQFQEWITNKHEGRIELIEINKKSPQKEINIEENKEIQVEVEMPKTEEKGAQEEIKEIQEEIKEEVKKEIEDKENTKNIEDLMNTSTIRLEDTQIFKPIKKEQILSQNFNEKKPKKELGFTFFIMLGIITAIVAIVGLYFML